eukprot:GHVL01023473.1.p1 GENE.GHVL01023473.1~~GHVL01023473.1.p1  ORF type:complete len:396 (+),score=77.29 GHVL01023473.1:35-1189(+)
MSIYWEKQTVGRLCGLHCVNSLLQGPVFSEVDMNKISKELDEQEKRLMAQGDKGKYSAEYKAFEEEGSSNVASDGYYSINTLEKVLKKKGFDCVNANRADVKTNVLDPKEDFGYICNHSDHWFAIRKLMNQWWNLDSLKPAPIKIGELYLREFFRELIGNGYSIFVISGFLPQPNPRQYTRLDSHQFFLNDAQIEERHQQHKKQDSKIPPEAGEEDSQSGGQAVTRREHVWPDSQGRRLTEPRALPEGFEVVDDEDQELQRAIQQSLNEFNQKLPPPSAEPRPDDPESMIIQVRGPFGAVRRRFHQSDPVKCVFSWLEFELKDKIQLFHKTEYSLTRSHPRQKFKKVAGYIGLLSDNDELDVTEINLQALGLHKQENFMLDCPV